jgi:hypothetical protein
MTDIPWSAFLNELKPFFYAGAGALLTYALTSRHERRKREEAHAEIVSNLSAALQAELMSVRDVLSHRITVIEQLITQGKNGGAFADINSLSQLFRANLDKIGMIGAVASHKVIRAYGMFALFPASVKITKGQPPPNWPEGDRTVFECSHEYPGLKFLIDEHRQLSKIVSEAIQELSLKSRVS